MFTHVHGKSLSLDVIGNAESKVILKERYKHKIKLEQNEKYFWFEKLITNYEHKTGVFVKIV